MKNLISLTKVIALLFFLGTFSFSFAQTNDTPDAYFKWKKDKTEFQKGYIVLLSGKRLDGQISLKNKNGKVHEIQYNGDGKELKLPGASLKSYGLIASVCINDSPENLYKWRQEAIVMGKTQRQTKPTQGYVVLDNGQRVSGELQLKEVEGTLDLFKIGKEKYSPDQVVKYGLQPTIAELTNDGKKVFKQEGKNFYSGSVLFANGENKDGVVAFRQSELINSMKPVAGHKYSNIYYAENQQAFVTAFDSKEVTEVVQNINGKEVKYQYYEGAFIPVGAMDNLSFKDKSREFQPGTVTLLDGSVIKGELAQTKSAGKFYTKSINFKDASGTVTPYTGQQVTSFTQTLEGETKDFFSAQGVFVEKMFEGNVFQLYRNPFPTTVNKFLSNLAQGAATAGTAVAADAISKQGAKNNALMSEESTEQFREVLANATPEELAEIEQVLEKSIDSMGDDALSKEAKKGLSSQLMATKTAIASRDIANSEGPGIKKKEWVIYNAKSDTETIIVESKYKNQVEHLLMGCYTYLGMEKSAQKEYVKFGNLKKAVTLLDECY